ncbi:Uncharacterized protein PECH_006106 [Penicillium ucsense]|uniref:Uncharacterized protein n=1 Tax=Penicillium ucsense TaxID=2839758 RepID=A0A8J8VZC8_9EURO|nr:Uncharacterized protein PECM_008190 [Penicillium ucsense]KAF7735856.1 Uncharacterized protein PECH_006106 [Penicillium ucsense]
MSYESFFFPLEAHQPNCSSTYYLISRPTYRSHLSIMAKKGGKKKNKGGAKPAATAAADKVAGPDKDVATPQEEVEQGSAAAADSQPQITSETGAPVVAEQAGATATATSVETTPLPTATEPETKEAEKVDEPLKQTETVAAPSAVESTAQDVAEKTQAPLAAETGETGESRDLLDTADDKVVLPTTATTTSPVASEPYPSTSEIAAEEPAVSSVPDTGVVAPISTLPERPKATDEHSELAASAVQPIATTASVTAPVEEPIAPAVEPLAPVSNTPAPVAEASKSAVGPVAPVAPDTETSAPAVTETAAPVSEALTESTAAPVESTTVPSAPTESDVVHAKRPYEKPIFSNDEVKPYKMPKTEEEQPAPGASTEPSALTSAGPAATVAETTSEPLSTREVKPLEDKKVVEQKSVGSAPAASTPAGVATGATSQSKATPSSPQAVAAAAAAFNSSKTDKSASTGPINVAGTEPKKPEPAAVRGEEPQPQVELPAESSAPQTTAQPDNLKSEEAKTEPSEDQQAEKKKGGFFAKLKRMFK